MNRDQTLLDANEVANIVFGGKKSVQAIQRAVRHRQLPFVRIGKRVFFIESVLRAWLADQMAVSVNVNPAPALDDKPGTIRRL